MSGLLSRLFNLHDLFKRYTKKPELQRLKRFDELVANVDMRQEPSIIICDDDCALKPFKKVESLDFSCILHQMIAHVRTELKLLSEESELHPFFADSLPINVPNYLVEQCNEQAMLLTGSPSARSMSGKA